MKKLISPFAPVILFGLDVVDVDSASHSKVGIVASSPFEVFNTLESVLFEVGWSVKKIS